MKLGELRSKTAHLPDDTEVFTDDSEYGIEDFNACMMDVYVEDATETPGGGLWARPICWPEKRSNEVVKSVLLLSHTGWNEAKEL